MGKCGGASNVICRYLAFSEYRGKRGFFPCLYRDRGFLRREFCPHGPSYLSSLCSITLQLIRREIPYLSFDISISQNFPGVSPASLFLLLSFHDVYLAHPFRKDRGTHTDGS